MFTKLKSILKNNKAFSNIEMAIGAIIIITIISVAMDFSKLAIQHNAISSNLNYISRIVEQQGGISNTKPSHYKGNYVTSKTVYNNIKDSLAHIGISEADWTLKIGSGTFTETFHKDNYNYKTRVTLTLTYNQKLPLVSNFFPSMGTTKRTISRQIITTHHPRPTDSGNIEYN